MSVFEFHFDRDRDGKTSTTIDISSTLPVVKQILAYHVQDDAENTGDLYHEGIVLDVDASHILSTFTGKLEYRSKDGVVLARRHFPSTDCSVANQRLHPRDVFRSFLVNPQESDCHLFRASTHDILQENHGVVVRKCKMANAPGPVFVRKTVYNTDSVGYTLLHTEVACFRMLSVDAHPHIPQVCGFYKSSLATSMVLNYYPYTLDHFVNQSNESYLLGCIRCLARTVAYVHQAGVIHGDLKPSNILVDAYNSVKLIDFQYAAVMTTSEKTARTIHVKGYSKTYSPNDEKMSRKWDVFSLGIIFTEVLSVITKHKRVSWKGYLRYCAKRAEYEWSQRALSEVAKVMGDWFNELSAPYSTLWLLCKKMISFSPSDHPQMHLVCQELEALLAMKEWNCTCCAKLYPYDVNLDDDDIEIEDFVCENEATNQLCKNIQGIDLTTIERNDLIVLKQTLQDTLEGIKVYEYNIGSDV
jgi:tRNA A-37 threonylcarbamoyl transferase component Bud32